MVKSTNQIKHNFGTIISVEIVDRIPIYSYIEESKHFLKITVRNPKYISCMRDKFEVQVKWNNMTFDDLTFESKVNLALRLMIDRDIVYISFFNLRLECHGLN